MVFYNSLLRIISRIYNLQKVYKAKALTFDTPGVCDAGLSTLEKSALC